MSSEPLENVRHERFAQLVVAGRSLVAAYAEAGFVWHRANARRLRAAETVAARITYLQQLAAERAEVSAERALRELGKVGFATIRSVVVWNRGRIKLTNSSAIPDDTMAAIAEVFETDRGIRVRMHNKQAALDSILRHLSGKGAATEQRAAEANLQPLPTSQGSVVDAREAFKRFGKKT